MSPNRPTRRHFDESRRRLLQVAARAAPGCAAAGLTTLLGGCSGFVVRNRSESGRTGAAGEGKLGRTGMAGASEWDAARAVVSEVKTPEFLPTWEDLRKRVRALAARSKRISIQQVGVSASGRPIEFVGIGTGERTALLVGAPHPNEPVGCQTILTMIELLDQNPGLLARLGFRWNFIPCVEPDGVVLNGGWLGGPLTPERYFEHFYRPAFASQAEYTFPLQVGQWQFEHPTPENRAWRAALAKTRPELLVSLHNAEYGGAFFLMSRARTAFAERLSSAARESGFGLNDFGDGGPYSPRLSAGVFEMFKIPGMIEHQVSSGLTEEAAWPAGDSSLGYSQDRFGSLGLVMECPYWEDNRLHDPSPSGRTPADVNDEVSAWNAKNLALLERSLETLAPAAPSELRPLVTSLREARTSAQGSTKRDSLNGDQTLTVAEYNALSVSQRLYTVRPAAMLRRLAHATGAAELEAESAAVVARRLAVLREVTSFSIVPLQRLVKFHLLGILAGAETVARTAS